MPSISHFYIHREYELWNAVLPNDFTNGTAILSTSDDDEDNEAIDAEDCNYLVLYIYLSLGSSSSMDLKIYFTDNATTTLVAAALWYQEVGSSVTAGVSTDSMLSHRYSASGTYRLIVPIMDKYIKIMLIGKGDPANSIATIKGLVGTA